MPGGAPADGIVRGMYALERSSRASVNLLGSGAIMTEVLAGAETLRVDGQAGERVERHQLHRNSPARAWPRNGRRCWPRAVPMNSPYVETLLDGENGDLRRRLGLHEVAAAADRPLVPGARTRYLVRTATGCRSPGTCCAATSRYRSEWVVFAALSTLAQANKGTVKDATRRMQPRRGSISTRRCRTERIDERSNSTCI